MREGLLEEIQAELDRGTGSRATARGSANNAMVKVVNNDLPTNHETVVEKAVEEAANGKAEEL